MAGKRLTAPLVRKMLDGVLRTDADFIRICQDYFPNVRNRFSDGMDRVSRVNLLLQLHTPTEISKVLHKEYPTEAARWLRDLAETPSRQVLGSLKEKPLGSIRPLRKSERLYSNLLPLIHIAPTLNIAPARYRTRQEIFSRLIEVGGPRHIPGDWILRGHNFMSFREISRSPWHWVCENEAMEAHQTAGWSYSDNPDLRREFVDLISRTLSEILGPSVRYHGEQDCYYFRAHLGRDGKLGPRKIHYRSHKKNTSREVVKIYSYGDQKQYTYYQHTAFHARFVCYNEQWFLSINPTYLYTSNGVNLYRFHADQLAGIKKLQNNDAVRGETYMWAEYLKQECGVTLLSRERKSLEFGDLVEFDIHVGINDAEWFNRESTDNTQDSLTGNLFEQCEAR